MEGEHRCIKTIKATHQYTRPSPLWNSRGEGGTLTFSLRYEGEVGSKRSKRVSW